MQVADMESFTGACMRNLFWVPLTSNVCEAVKTESMAQSEADSFDRLLCRSLLFHESSTRMSAVDIVEAHSDQSK